MKCHSLYVEKILKCYKNDAILKAGAKVKIAANRKKIF